MTRVETFCGFCVYFFSIMCEHVTEDNVIGLSQALVVYHLLLINLYHPHVFVHTRVHFGIWKPEASIKKWQAS